MLSVAAHETDVNVIAWNRATTYMLASGADDGTLRVWDLRAFAAGAPVANFAYHRCAAVPGVVWWGWEGVDGMRGGGRQGGMCQWGRQVSLPDSPSPPPIHHPQGPCDERGVVPLRVIHAGHHLGRQPAGGVGPGP